MTFEVIARSHQDPLSYDPKTPKAVLAPVSVGSEVPQETVDLLIQQMAADVEPPVALSRGIGAQFNKYFGDFPDDGTDYLLFFRAIDEGSDDL
jgi:hypothetical protein